MRTALTLFFALLCSIAVAHTDGIYNRTANSIGDTQGIDSAVSSGVAALVCSYTPVTTGTQNVAYTGATPAASGGVLAYTFSETGSLPTGITINSGTGVISGTPSVSGTFAGIQVKVTDAALTVANCGTAFTLTIAPSFQGPGDVVSGAVAWGSCARVYNASLASTATSLCDLKDATTGTVAICTLRGSSTGFVDLAGSYCTGSATPAVACAAAAGGSCVVSKLYDQTGTGNFWSTATLAAMPALTFSALNGLPGLTGAGLVVLPTGNITQAGPLSFSYVSKRTGAFTTLQNVFSISGGAIIAGYAASINNATLVDVGTVTAAASDSAFHALQMIVNATGTVVVDGAATTGALSTNGLTATPLRLMSANGAGAGLTGVVMEVGMWPGAFNATQYGNMDTNQHSAANGYNF